jgi:hypothetical protein
MNDRVLCRICETAILPVTAKINAGLCGQCVRDPERAGRRATRKKTVLSWGPPSPQAVRSRLSDACQAAAEEAVNRFSGERIYGFFLCLDPCWRSVSGARVFTEAWRENEAGTNPWTPLYTKETHLYIVGEAATATVSEFASSLATGDNLLPACLYALGALRDRSVFTDRVVLGASSGDESPEETLAFVEVTNRSAAANWYASTISYDQTELDLRRQQLREKSKTA